MAVLLAGHVGELVGRDQPQPAQHLVPGVVPWHRAGATRLRRSGGKRLGHDATAGGSPAQDGGGRAVEERLRAANRALHMLTRCNEAVLRATSEEKLYADVCRVIVETGGYSMCWVGLAQDDARRSILPVAHAGPDEGYLASAEIVWAEGERGQGPTGTAVRTGEPVGSAFDRLAATTGVPLVARFADGIAIAVERGTPLADVLHAQAADVREAGRRELIETAARKEVFMMVPVVFLILPITILFAFYPGVIGIGLTTP